MSAELLPILSWTFVSECSIPGDVNSILIDGETAIAAYKTFKEKEIIS